MEEQEFQKKLEGILHKRRNCIPLSPEEEKLVDTAVNKLLDGKQSVRKSLTVKTGEEMRKADIPERKQLQVSTDTSAAPIRQEDRSDKKEEAKPKEDTSGKVNAEYTEEEYADTDEVPYDPHYEENRLADILEGKKEYKNSIRIKTLVAKALSNGHKLVGQVIKVYNPDKFGRYAIMVKWSNGSFEHINANQVEILKAEKPEETQAEAPKEEASVAKEVTFTPEAPSEFIEEVVKTLTETTDMSKDEIVAMAKAAWSEIYEANKTTEDKPAEKPAQE